MLLYALIMFATALLFLVLGIAIYRGKTDLIHDYHQKNVSAEQRPAYGRAFSVGMFTMSGTLLLSGIISFFGDSDVFAMISVAVMAVGFALSFAVLWMVQKKYNGGLF